MITVKNIGTDRKFEFGRRHRGVRIPQGGVGLVDEHTPDSLDLLKVYLTDGTLEVVEASATVLETLGLTVVAPSSVPAPEPVTPPPVAPVVPPVADVPVEVPVVPEAPVTESDAPVDQGETHN